MFVCAHLAMFSSIIAVVIQELYQIAVNCVVQNLHKQKFL